MYAHVASNAPTCTVMPAGSVPSDALAVELLCRTRTDVVVTAYTLQKVTPESRGVQSSMIGVTTRFVGAGVGAGVETADAVR